MVVTKACCAENHLAVVELSWAGKLPQLALEIARIHPLRAPNLRQDRIREDDRCAPAEACQQAGGEPVDLSVPTGQIRRQRPGRSSTQCTRFKIEEVANFTMTEFGSSDKLITCAIRLK